MSITPYTGDLPSLARPNDFSDDATAVFAWLTGTAVPEFNATEATLSAAAMGALTIPMVFSTTTTVADPTAGKVRLNNATQSSATALLVDVMDSAGTDRTAFLDAWDDSTSAVKGVVGIMAAGDPSKWLAFNVSAVATPSGYRNVTVTYVGGSASSPFSDGDAVVLAFQRTGDIGPVAQWTEIASYSGPYPQATIDFVSIPQTWSDLLITFAGASHTNGSSQPLVMLVGDGVTLSSGQVSISNGTTAAGALYGSAIIPGYRLGQGHMLGSGDNLPSSPGTISGAISAGRWRVDGGVKSIRVYAAAGNLDDGVFKLWGK